MAYSFRDLVYFHGGNDASVQVDVVLAKKVGVLRLYPQEAEGDCVPHWA